MAVTETTNQSSQKSKHKKDYGVNSVNSPTKNSYQRPGNVSEEEDDSETDLDRPLFKKPPQVNRNSPQPPKNSVHGDSSDSESDPDDPPKRPSFVKPATAAAQEPSDDSENEEMPQSISLMQYNNTGMPSHRKSPQLKDAAKHPKVNRTPNPPEMSASESESESAEEPDVDENAHKPQQKQQKQQQQKIQQQQQQSSSSSSDSEEETENPPRQQLQQRTSITNKEPSSSDSSSFEEETESNENPPRQQMRQQTSITSKQPSSSDSEGESEINETPLPHNQIHQTQHQQPQQQLSESENESESGTTMNPELNRSVKIKQEILTPDDPNMDEEEEEDTNDDDEDEENERSNPWSESSGWERSRLDLGVNSSPSLSLPTASQQAQQALLFQQQHTPVSAPVVEISPDSRVWLMQVPRSIPAAELHGKHLPVNPMGGEMLKLPSGHWRILKQQFHDSAKPLACILSSGHLIYGIRWLEPESYWSLKRAPRPLQMENKTLAIRKEIHPIPIKKLLKMKTNPARIKLKRARDSSPDEKSERYGDSSINPQKRRKKQGDHSIMESGVEKQKKRKRGDLVEEESPTRKRKKTKASESEDTYGQAEDSCLCDRSDKKKKKHKEKSEEPQLSSVNVALKKEILSSQESESSSGKRHKRRKQEVDTPSEDSHYQNQISGNEESFETHTKKKKKKSKENSDQEMLQSHDMKTYEEAPYVAEDKVEKKKKKKHKHGNERETEGEMLEEVKTKQKPQVEEEQEESSKKNKKKHKHKDRDHPKVKQEKDFWERETSPNFLKRLYLTQALPEDK